MFKSFASEGVGIPLAAEPILQLGPIHFTNSMLFGLITAVAVLILFAIAAARTSVRPRSKFAFTFETLTELALGTIEENLGNRQKAIKHLPLLLTLFVFILFSNLSGLIPGVGTLMTSTPEGDVPLLRAFTIDLNATLGMAILTIGTVQFFALKELGLIRHLKHYFNGNLLNPMTWFIGIIEVMSEFIRIVTLSLRLFGVIYAGEVLIHVVAELTGNFAWAATFPLYLLEIFFSVIQAYLFVMLSTVYLAMATHSDDQHESKNDEVHSPAPVNPVKATET